MAVTETLVELLESQEECWCSVFSVGEDVGSAEDGILSFLDGLLFSGGDEEGGVDVSMMDYC